MFMLFLARYWQYVTIAGLVAVLALVLHIKSGCDAELTTLKTTHSQTVKELDTLKQTSSTQHKEIVTVIVQPDGTKTTRTEKDTTDTKVSEDSSDKEHGTTDTTENSKTALSRYQIDVYKSLNDRTFGGAFGARLGNLPVFGKVLTTDNGKSWGVGIGVEW
jgi:hypothetical protein